MQPQVSNKPVIEVCMLGEFSIKINGHQPADSKGRSKRVWMLIEYLLANRKKDVSVDMLTEVLWEDDECKDPLNALKNLVYRARELLKNISYDDKAEFIKFVRNTYAWNNNYLCTIDTEQLVECWKIVQDSAKPDEVRIQACKKATELYQGKFLPKWTYSTWVISTAAWYSSLYNKCVLVGCNILAQKKYFDDIIDICELALTHLPLEESISKMLLYAYINTNQRKKALDFYSNTIKLFKKELDVDISESLRPFYKQLVNKINHIEMHLNVIEDDLQEPAHANGAYYCNYDVFKSIYQIQKRIMTRTQFSTFIILFTLSDLNGDLPGQNIIKPAMKRMKEAILTGLRKGDTVAPYSTTQFIVMLPLINYNNAKAVTNRILQKFKNLYHPKNVRVETQIDELSTDQKESDCGKEKPKQGRSI